MKKKFFTFFFALASVSLVQAQAWDGSVSSDWNTPANWTPSGVPLTTGNVTIPNVGVTNWPALAANTTVNSIDMHAGSQLDFNGFNLTINTPTSGFSYFTGATLNNSNAGTDIAVFINSAPGYNTYVRSTTVNDHITFNISGTAGLNDADNSNTGNHYIGNLVINFGSTGTLYLSLSDTSLYDGNVIINRTSAGVTDAFNSGGIIGGNFSFTNNTTGNSLFGITTKRTSIAGTVNIAITDTTTVTAPSSFELYRLVNQTNGGTISVQNTRGFDLRNDTLKVNALNITGYRGADYGYLQNNNIIGNITIVEGASHIAGYFTYIRDNIITGNANFTSNAQATGIYEADNAGAGNQYTGNVSFTMNSTGILYLSLSDTSFYDGNLTINRTGAGVTDAFNSGAVIGGDFSFTNNTTGNSLFGIGSKRTSIGGTINISINDSTTVTAPGSFELFRLVNQTNGGTINVQNTRGFDVRNDTLKVNAMNITGYRGTDYGYLLNNNIIGNITIVEGVTHFAGYFTYIRENIITGNANFTSNAVATGIYETDNAGAGNQYTGNVSFTMNSTGILYLSYSDTSFYDGNLTINRTGAGVTDAFNGGAVIGGNFSFTNNTSGNSLFGISSKRTSIGGTINININDTATVTLPGTFELIRVINQTTGGTISVQNSRGFDVRNDTLKLNAMNLTGYRSTDYGYLYNNDITGNVTTVEAAAHVAGYHTYLRENIITGNSSFTLNSSTNLYDADAAGSGNKYIGDVSYTRNTGSIIVGSADTTEISQHLTLNSSSNITLDKVKFIGAANGVIEQLGIQPIIIANLLIEKSGTGNITLNDSVIISNKTTFTSGNIYTSATKELIFEDGTTHSGSSVTSHVVGPFVKIGNDIFTFPLGTPTSLYSIGITAPTGVTSRFRAQYKNQNPGSDGYNANSLAGTLTNISKAGYWNVERQIGATNVTLTLGFSSNPYEQYPVIANLKVAQWNGSQWDDKGMTSPTGDGSLGTITNSVALTTYTQFALANVTPTYFYLYSNPGTGPDGTPVKIKGTGGMPGYQTKQLPAGTYSADSVYLVPNATAAGFKLRDSYNVEKDDTTITAPVAPTIYISANGSGVKNFAGWRHFVYLTNGSNEIIGAIRDNDLTLGNTTMTAYFSTANVATAPNGNIYLKRSFKITSQFAPAGTKRVRFYISKTEYNNLVAADPASFPNGINSLTITKYTGPQEDSLFNPIPGSNSIIVPNNAITIADLGTMYSLDIDVTGFSGFYIGGNQSNLSVCKNATVSISSDISGATYQWQVDNGGGYTNISDGGVYGGATTNTLTLTNIPGSMYGYKLRAVVNGGTFSQVYILKFTVSWLGTVSTAWENAANWSCGQLPDADTDILVNPGKPNYPQVNANTSIRSLIINPGASVTVNTGVVLTILK